MLPPPPPLLLLLLLLLLLFSLAQLEVPKPTLNDKTKSYKQNIPELITMKLGRVSVLSVTLENVLLRTLLW